MQLIEVTDVTFERTKAAFSDRKITGMLYVIGTYRFLPRLARTGRVPLDDKPADAPSTSCPLPIWCALPATMQDGFVPPRRGERTERVHPPE